MLTRPILSGVAKDRGSLHTCCPPTIVMGERQYVGLFGPSLSYPMYSESVGWWMYAERLSTDRPIASVAFTSKKAPWFEPPDMTAWSPWSVVPAGALKTFDCV